MVGRTGDASSVSLAVAMHLCAAISSRRHQSVAAGGYEVTAVRVDGGVRAVYVW